MADTPNTNKHNQNSMAAITRLIDGILTVNKSHLSKSQNDAMTSAIEIGVQQGLNMAANLCASRNQYILAETIIKLNLKEHE